jgi:hypothetical protein
MEQQWASTRSYQGDENTSPAEAVNDEPAARSVAHSHHTPGNNPRRSVRDRCEHRRIGQDAARQRVVIPCHCEWHDHHATFSS